MFDLHPSGIPGCVELQPIVRGDARGRFVKTFHRDFFAENGLCTDFAEQYYSVSQKGVLRGLHFQTPPADHEKLVYCTEGEVFDVVVDLRRGSPTFGQHRAFTLSAAQGNQLYIPKGLAHGFCVSVERATMVYNVTTVYSPDSDHGILWSSAEIPWPLDDPQISPRDATFPTLGDFDSPFAYTAEG